MIAPRNTLFIVMQRMRFLTTLSIATVAFSIAQGADTSALAGAAGIPVEAPAGAATSGLHPSGTAAQSGLADFQVAGEAKASLNWMTDFDAAEAASARTGRAVLLNFTGSDWCGWCFRLRDEVFLQPAFGNYAASDLVLVEVDFPREKQQSSALKLQNAGLAKRYGVEGYPTIVLIDAKGTELGRTGYMQGGAKTFVRALRKMRAGSATGAGKS